MFKYFNVIYISINLYTFLPFCSEYLLCSMRTTTGFQGEKRITNNCRQLTEDCRGRIMKDNGSPEDAEGGNKHGEGEATEAMNQKDSTQLL